MNTLEKYQELKRLLVEKQREADKSAGALDEILKQLSKDYKCKSLKQGRELLAKIQEKEKTFQERFETRLNKFKKKFDRQLVVERE